ncbi:MAG: hypothetical protein K0Q80_961 [Microvirga sp.]|nr:hypothetical protein [Microvirga sp.]
MSLCLEPLIRLPQTSMAEGVFSAGMHVLPEETPAALTLVAVVSEDSLEVFTHPERVHHLVS